MSTRFVFAGRSSAEINIFGGTVYADIDGLNVATISSDTVTIEVQSGKHIVKMYKSHNYGSMIGFAEVEIDAEDGKDLLFRYKPPVLVNQPGHILTSDFVSYEEIQEGIEADNRMLNREKSADDFAKRTAEEANRKNNTWIIVLVFVIPAICWMIWYLTFMDAFFW